MVDVQRAAGNITPEQSDYNYVTKSLGHNGLRGLVYAPASLQESVDIMYMAFDKAEACQTPVFIMLDGMLGQMEEPVRLPEFKKREKPLPYLVPSGCRGRKPTLFLAQPMAEYPGDTGEDADGESQDEILRRLQKMG